MASNIARNIARNVVLSMFVLPMASCAIGGRQSAPVDPTADFDLAQYFFHEKISSSDSSVRYTENYYKKNARPAIVLRPEFQYQRSGSTINVQSPGIEGFLSQYTITKDSIKEFRPSINDSRTFHRYARLGETFMDSGFTSVNVSESCVLSDFIETFHLSSATGEMVLSDDTYNDVIRVRCVSEFTSRATNRTNYRWSIYYAKNIGPIFKDGDWANNLGQIYSIYDY